MQKSSSGGYILLPFLIEHSQHFCLPIEKNAHYVRRRIPSSGKQFIIGKHLALGHIVLIFPPYCWLPYSSDAGFKSWDVACCVSLSRYTTQSYPRIDSTVKEPASSVLCVCCSLRLFTPATLKNPHRLVSSSLAPLIKINFHHIKNFHCFEVNLIIIQLKLSIHNLVHYIKLCSK